MLIDDEDDGENQHEPLDQRQIAIDHGLDRHVADAGIGEDALDNDRAADQEGELHAGQRERRADRVAQRLLQNEPQLGHALEPREQHIVLRHRFVERAFEHARDDRRERKAERQRRHGEVPEDVEEHVEPEP